MDFVYPYSLIADEDETMLRFPDFPEILTTLSPGEIEVQQVNFLAMDAVKTALQVRIDYGDQIPSPSTDSASSTGGSVFLPPVASAKIMLYLAIRERGWSRAVFARQAGISATDASRLLDLFHETRSDLLMLAFQKLGISLRTSMKTEPEHAREAQAS